VQRGGLWRAVRMGESWDNPRGRADAACRRGGQHARRATTAQGGVGTGEADAGKRRRSCRLTVFDCARHGAVLSAFLCLVAPSLSPLAWWLTERQGTSRLPHRPTARQPITARGGQRAPPSRGHRSSFTSNSRFHFQLHILHTCRAHS
jgi:hypothetical protein